MRTKDSELFEISGFMQIIALKICCGDEVWVAAEGEKEEFAAETMVMFLESDFTVHTPTEMQEVDQLLHENAFTAEQIFFNMANGLLVTNKNNIVTLCNPAAARLIGKSAEKIIGKDVRAVIPNTRLPIVAKTGASELASRQMIGKSVTLTNRTPIVIDGEVRGATAIFEDISALEKIKWEFYEVKELQERMQLILETVQDGICVVDKDGKVIYVNPAYLRIVNKTSGEVIGQNVYESAPDGTRCKALKTGKPQINCFSKKKNGTMVIANVYPIMVDGVRSGVVSVIKNITEFQQLLENLSTVSAKADYLEQELLRTKQADKAFGTYIGASGKILDVLSMATKAAKSNATVLIRGESGTGKELVAEGIHYASARAKGPFVRVNCGAIPSALLESELFGHEKGAFTGAVRQKLGRFELANRGTLFLDEIGEMDKNMQAKLLRALQQKEFYRVGGEDIIKVDVRIIAATNRPLEAMVKDGSFRDDLYYRLNVIPLFLPPLRERVEDIPLLAEYFINKLGKDGEKNVKGITKAAMEVLMAYRWPGNVRELENAIERIITLMEGEYIEISNLPDYIKREDVNEAAKALPKKKDSLVEDGVVLEWAEYEKAIIANALKKGGSFNAAGKLLKLTHKTVAAKARKYGLVED
jgi:PAS domain S-box-containing protein